MIDFTRSRVALRDSQKEGVERLVEMAEPARGRTLPGCFALFDEMGVGKTLQTIYAAQELYVRNEINLVLVITPAPVRPVWFHPELGQIREYLWDGLPTMVREYHSAPRTWSVGAGNRLEWVVTNYEYLIRDENLKPLIAHVKASKTMLVLDESSFVKSRDSERTAACLALRVKARRSVLLNGTPISQSPADMYSQGMLLDWRILGCKSWWEYRARYAVLATMEARGHKFKDIVGWKHPYSITDGQACCQKPQYVSEHVKPGEGLDDLQRRFAPYVLRRLKKDCLDLPPALPAVTLTATLSPKTWKLYKEMRDQLVAWLSEQEVAVAPHAGTKVMRLAQITSGFVGGVEDPETGEVLDTREVGREKLDLVLEEAHRQMAAELNARLLIWCRFRPEQERLHARLSSEFPGVTLGQIRGGQKTTEREAGTQLLDPRAPEPDGPVIVTGTTQTGQMGLNLARSHVVIYCSNDTKLSVRLQSMDRVHRPPQRYPVSYFDVVAQGPSGEKTVDHTIFRALREHEDLATWTTSAWVRALEEE